MFFALIDGIPEGQTICSFFSLIKYAFLSLAVVGCHPAFASVSIFALFSTLMKSMPGFKLGGRF